MLRQLLLLILCFILLPVSPISTVKAAASEVKGALCVVRADDKLVLVHEILTDKISLPGGTIIDGESPKVAAQRETWEETGLVVTVGEELGRTDTAVYYDCISDSEIIAFSMNNSLGGNELPIWFAPHYGVEIASAMLLGPSELPSFLYRYPAQWPQAIQFFEQATQQSASYVTQLIESAPSFRQIELRWMKDLQSWVGALSETSFEVANQISNLVIELTEPTILLFLFPLVMMRFGSRFVFRLFFAISATSLMVLVAQQGFALPRPHVYIPMMELTHSFGFSFPSLPIAVWFCVLTFLFQRTRYFGLNGTTAVMMLITLTIMLCKFFLGSAFFLDMLFGALLGSLVAWHVLRLETNQDVNVDQVLSSKGVWFIMTAVTAVISVIWPLPVFGRWLAILITASALVMTFRESKVHLDSRQMIFVTLALVFVEQLYLYSSSVVSFSGLWSLVLSTLHYPLLMLLFILLARKLIHEKQQRETVLD
ncbi:bifunctional NUDIX hydrolase/phosphatase PAP2 family protein [Vibrio diabolicus]|uniref:bifunctional NUDIX hydrolase/phosphatase PAP2 family protein n=1 Tax=Vibrio diabolicus TaxID=50719 RepID=UPI00232D7CBF|nr:bifunctional NUDIX hydrolase/phosphatase PAP2 family protein [Vibrio diabolicus]